MAKVKKFANGGALGDVVGTASQFTAPPGDNSKAPSAAPPINLSYGGSGQPDSANAPNQDQNPTLQNINAASTALQMAPRYKKGGHITTRRVSSVTKSSKAPCW
jgi:hypothetical protein